MDIEDFSFPTVSDTCTYNFDSHPLWNLSPKGSSNSYHVLVEGSKENEKDCFEAKLVSKGKRKSFSCVQNGKETTVVDDEEVPMDLLWEVFNEELSSASRFAHSSSKETVEFKYARALTVAKTNGSLLQTKYKPSMVVIVKVLKKLFSLNNSQGKPKKRVF
ncbi:uncharacterized protein LOC113871768 [Abrus precatorius]|uniref:Uncharacterized protein LOC113871768 n=1 Tax=Abrus precatorius TaxID=3816 RepID=A0A8B8M9K6_ABRPR|nr:uncharacterized protein LOC113871768 [Abrus precatorius]